MNKIKYTILVYIVMMLISPMAQAKSGKKPHSSASKKASTPFYRAAIALDTTRLRDTVCINMQTINSTKDDYLPFLIGKNLLFTSNRKNTQEGQTLEYSEKVYFSTQKGKNKWSPAKKNGYKWNSDNNTALIGVGDALYYFYRSYWKDNGEIFTAEREEDPKKPWKASQLKKMSRICTEFDESSVTPSNGDSVFFVSNRYGNYDIFLQVGEARAIPVTILNTEFNENDVFFSFPNQTLYFSSDRPGGVGGYDVYKAPIIDNKFEKPTLLKDTMVNSTSNDRDFRWYNDSTMYFASDRKLGMGGYDIYEVLVKSRKKPNPKDTTKVAVVPDTVAVDSIQDQKDQLYDKLKELGLFPFKGEVQVGAYRYIPTLAEFLKKFPCITKENIRMDAIDVDGIKVHKYIIDTTYTDVDIAINKQVSIEAMHCLPDQLFSDMPFIGMLDKKGNRFAIFWKKDEFEGKNIFYIFKNGKMIWKNRRF